MNGLSEEQLAEFLSEAIQRLSFTSGQLLGMSSRFEKGADAEKTMQQVESNMAFATLVDTATKP